MKSTLKMTQGRAKSKYHATKVRVDGIVFDSKKEARRYQELKKLEDGGAISSLELQPKFLLQPKYKKNGKTIRAIYYIADFCYVDMFGNQIVEDCKGMKTEVYKLKKKLFEYCYPDLMIKES